MTELHEQRTHFVQKVPQMSSEDLLKNGLELEAERDVIAIPRRLKAEKVASTDQAWLCANKRVVRPTRPPSRPSPRPRPCARSHEQIAMQIRPKLIENLDRIIAESVKQMENIDPIKIVQVEGLSSGASVGVDGCAQDGNLSGQVVTSALRYRTQQRIAMEQEVAEREISKARAVETQDIEKAKAIELSEQDRNIVVAEKSRPSPKPRHRLTRRWLWLFRRRSSQGGARS